MATSWTFDTVVGVPVTGVDGDASSTSRANKWRVSLCGCCEYPLSCLSTFFCEACVIGQTASIAANGSRNICLATTAVLLFFGILGFSLQFVSSASVSTVGMVLSWIGGVIALFTICYARVAIRKRNNIDGTGFGDCCVSFWCSACSICQMLNQYSPYRGPFATYTILDEESGSASVTES